MNISEVFERILVKPEFFLGAVSVTRLSVYLEGYTKALIDAKVPFDDEDLRMFYKWTEKKYDFWVNANWANIVVFVSFGDESRAMELTKMLWIEYQNEKSHEAGLIEKR